LRDQEGEIAAIGADLFAKLDGKLPREWKEEEDGLQLTSLDFLKETLAEVGPMLRAHLKSGETL
jgi:hypothetical protein